MDKERLLLLSASHQKAIIKNELEAETGLDGDLKCPYCGSGVSDAWELHLDDCWEEVECDNCGESFLASREVSVEYESKKIVSDEDVETELARQLQ